MSDADWIEEAARDWYESIATTKMVDVFRQAHAAHLAKLDTSGIAERIADYAWDECCDSEEAGVNRFHASKLKLFITAALAPLLERQRQMVEVLRECREIVQERHDAGAFLCQQFPSYRQEQESVAEAERMTQLLSRIDTIIKERHSEDQ